MSTVYEMVKSFKNEYPGTVCWRIKAHSKIIERHLNPDEEVRFAFAAQKSFSPFDIFSTYVIAVTNKRLMVAQKRVLFGYTFLSITPDMFNDLTIKSGIIWGKVCIDTIKEVTMFSNVSKSALPAIETNITENIMNEKKKYTQIDRDSN